MINIPKDTRNRQPMQHRLIVSINPMPREAQAVQGLMERIEKMPGVRTVSIHAQTEMAYVIFDDTVVSADAIIAAINDQTVHRICHDLMNPGMATTANRTTIDGLPSSLQESDARELPILEPAGISENCRK